MKKYLLFFFPLLSLDILTKVFALHFIPPLLPKQFGYPYGGIALFDLPACSFSLNTVYNSGAAWGIFQGHPGFLFAVRAAIIVGLLLYLASMQRRQLDKNAFAWNLFSLWLVATGAIGNSLDYLAYGHVVDFLHVCFWQHTFPIFNFADCYITLGVGALLLMPRKFSQPNLKQ